jgi:hypothetical protein
VRIILAVLCFSAAAALAQDEGQLQSEFRLEGQEIAKDCTRFRTILGCAQDFVTGKPLHITGGNLAPQNGVGAGPAFVYDKNVGESWRLSTNADAVVSTNGSWRTGVYLKALRTPTRAPEVITTRPSTAPSVHLEPVPEFNFYVQAISLEKLNYYGLGQFTSRPSLAMFGMRQIIAGGNVLYPLFGASGLAAYGELNGRWVVLRGRHGDTSPSIEQLYTDATAPGLAQQPGALQTGEGLKFARSLNARLALNYSAVLQQYSAVADSKYSFERLNLDFAHRIPLYRNMRSAGPAQAVGPDESPRAFEHPRFSRNKEGSVGLEAQVVASFIPSGHVVPFYFQPTLGGSDINGDRALASYPDYRFRAPNLMLFRADFEHSIWGPIGGMLTADTGRVALTRGDLGFNHLRHSYAAGLTIRAGGFPQVLLLFAWGGHEGTHTVAYISPALLGGGSRPSLY